MKDGITGFENIRRIYHGTRNPDLNPVYNGGMDYHDYGNGFYCTQDIEAAKEWACQHADTTTAYVYAYDLDMHELHPILNLNEMEPVYWLSALAHYRYGRSETNIQRSRRLEFIEAFPVDCERYEVIEGWRADDRYFAYLSLFLGLAISYEAVVQAMKLGNLGKQIVIKGKQAYRQCKQTGDKLTISNSDYEHYNNLYIKREREAESKLRAVRDIPGRLLTEIISRGAV